MQSERLSVKVSTLTLNFDFFKHPLCPYVIKEDLIVGSELNSSGKVILRSGDTVATYKLVDISLEYGVIFEDVNIMLEQHQFHIPK